MSQIIRYNSKTNDLVVRPKLDVTEIKELLLTHFGVEIDPDWKLKEFNSYDDRNYYIEGKVKERGHVLDEKYKEYGKFVLKVFNSTFLSKHKWYENVNKYMHSCSTKCGDTKLPLPLYGIGNTEMAVLCEIPLQANAEVIDCSISLEDISTKNEFISQKDGKYYVQHMARLSVYIPGTLVSLKTINDNQLNNFGKAVAILDLAFQDLTPPEVDLQESLIWNIVNIIKNDFYNPYINTLVDEDKKRMAENILSEFSSITLPKLKTLPKQWIHSDVNEQNVLFNESGNNDEIAGIIDFDDMVYSYRVVELGTSFMYVSATPNECYMENVKLFYQGFSSVINLNDIELECVFNIMLVRFVQSCCIGLYQYNYVDPGNEYLLVTNSTGWKGMKYFLTLGKDEFLKRLKEVHR